MREVNYCDILPRENVLYDKNLINYNTMHLETTAKTFLTVTNDKQLIEICKFLQSIRHKFIMLGKGSNVIFRSKIIKPIVVHLCGDDIRFYKKEDGFMVSVFAGVSLSALLKRCALLGASGMEWATGIPGSVGGAILMNAGANGGCMADIVKNVVIYKDFKVKKIDKKDCGFGYRKSALGDAVIIRVALFLPFGDKIKIKSQMEKFFDIRRAKSAKGFSAGSIFKNSDKPAGWYIEQAGLKGVSSGGAVISTEHANVIINKGNATSKDVLRLMRKVKRKVYKKFGTLLEPEVKII